MLGVLPRQHLFSSSANACRRCIEAAALFGGGLYLFATPLHDPAVALVHVLAGKVTASLVTVAGRILVRDGVVLHTDNGLSARIAALGERLQQWRLLNVPAL